MYVCMYVFTGGYKGMKRKRPTKSIFCYIGFHSPMLTLPSSSQHRRRKGARIPVLLTTPPLNFCSYPKSACILTSK